MVQFEQLINNRYFLLTFIEVLESQKSFSIRDKVNVASLLMVILMSKMEYATEILRLLLLRLIDKSINSKYPQLMLRRTESVVEKFLTNWMALCLYDHLRSESAASLFLLTAAIKHQVEKGPVDALTHDARYSLSEERLLREQIPHGTVVSGWSKVGVRLWQERGGSWICCTVVVSHGIDLEVLSCREFRAMFVWFRRFVMTYLDYIV